MLDPAAPSPQTDQQRLNQRLAQQDRRAGQLERNARIPVGNGPPSADPTKLPESAEYIDRLNRRKYYVIGDGASAATHVWRYVALT